MRFAFATIPAQPFDELCELVRFAEALGYARAWMPDQAFFKDPFVLLGTLAQRVERIGLGLGVVNPYTRHPAVVARGAATLAEVTGGRFALAYGAGNRRELLDRLGDLAVRARVDRARLSLNHRDPDDVRSGLTLEKMGLAGSPVGAWSRFATEGSGD